MKKITHRAVAVLLLAAAVICGMIVYVLRYVDEGEDWALYFSRANSGSTGQLSDRYGEILAYFNGYENLFSSDELTRIANYHVTGDYWGRTGSGILEEYWNEVHSFDIFTGTTLSEHSTMELNIDAFLNRVIYTQLNLLEKPPEEEEEKEEEGEEGEEGLVGAEGEAAPGLTQETFIFPVETPLPPSPGIALPTPEAAVGFALGPVGGLSGSTEAAEASLEPTPTPVPTPRVSDKLNGAVLVCNYRTGELIGMVSTPSYDPMSDESMAYEGAYINRCLSASFIPGSIFKLITAAAAIENLPDLYEDSFYCHGEFQIAGVPITCMVPHQEQNFEQAMANSCNCFFARLAVRLGQDTLIKYVKDFGFLEAQTLDGISTAVGSFPLEFVGDPETAWAGIGQSTDLVNPYAMLRFVSAVANGGVLKEPSLILDEDEILSSRYMSPDTAKKLQDLMRNNVSAHYGGEEAFPELNICAKTGTAELGDGTTHAWFVGFLEDEKHPFAFVTFVEQGGRGLEVAGTLTNKIFQQYFTYR